MSVELFAIAPCPLCIDQVGYLILFICQNIKEIRALSVFKRCQYRISYWKGMRLNADTRHVRNYVVPILDHNRSSATPSCLTCRQERRGRRRRGCRIIDGDRTLHFPALSSSISRPPFSWHPSSRFLPVPLEPFVCLDAHVQPQSASILTLLFATVAPDSSSFPVPWYSKPLAVEVAATAYLYSSRIYSTDRREHKGRRGCQACCQPTAKVSPVKERRIDRVNLSV